LKHVVYPSYYTGKAALKRYYVTAMLRWSAKRANRIVTVSEYTKSDLVESFGVSPDRITAIPLGPGAVKPGVAGSPPVETPYFLFVGRLRPHKNLPRLVDAYVAYRQQSETAVALVIAGGDHDGAADDLQSRVPAEFVNDVHILGRVDEQTLARLYANALAFVFPSLYEGFGLPPLEAMGYGTPVIASDRTAVPEVVGDGGVFVDPEQLEDISSALEEVATSPALRGELSRAAGERFSKFSWERTARETLSVYQQLLET
jgi:glycosyltransferase involved in cell wall biosynthesis